MSVTAILELNVKPEQLDAAPPIFADVLAVTRAFAGNVSVVVTQDHAEPTHFLVVETWESLEADAAYRLFRAGEESSPLAPLLTGPPKLTIAITRDDI